MFQEKPNSFLIDFGNQVIYSSNNYARKVLAIFDNQGFVNDLGVSQDTFILESNSNIVIGGEISDKNDVYIIDGIVDDDHVFMTVSVVKQ